MRINLLPPPRLVLRARVWIFSLIIAGALAATAYEAAVWVSNRQDISGQQALISAQESQLAAMQAQWSRLQSEQAGVKLVEQMNAIRDSKSRASVGLRAVLWDLPFVSTITGLTYSDASLSLTATFSSLAAAAKTIRTFQGDKSFSSVSVTSVTTDVAQASSAGTSVVMVIQLPSGSSGGAP